MYQSIRVERGEFPLISDSVDSATPDKHLDVFISYRRNNGSQLASLLKVYYDCMTRRISTINKEFVNPKCVFPVSLMK